MLDAFFDKLPPPEYDPSTNEIEIADPPPINPSAMLIQRLILMAYIQLYNAVDMGSPAFAELYVKRLAMSKKSMLLSRAFIDARLPYASIPIHCAVSYARMTGFSLSSSF